jgi:succinate dehydrogenase hydrophobic membrane anchor protein
VRAIEGTIAPTKKETNMSVNYGSKRTVVGAHYGLRDWLSQRVTAALMVLFTVVVLVQLVASKGPIGYDLWAGIFSAQWMKVLTFSVIVAMAWHVWVGVSVTSSWTTSSPWACVWPCRFSPLSGWSAALAGVSRFCGVSDSRD